MSKNKRIKVIGKWAADRGYDAWDIFIGKMKWCRLMAVTSKPIECMLQNNPTANIDWYTVRAVKLT
ncbi:hypothetical protein LCGC14_1303830 [marine sediment metagenome]|uniref:Uncharacterized protein n=1 Tax=marine sediment metagenome TaxID=412755 RepID=A0A0F9KP82_9ZZZZ